ncbi:hypothetical protein OS493_023795 [Desmophyllum pertusum]|uniref:histone acetyltransferase n=1 Tax=Desmophyllum pertusum TaxID=174260 RepID=A0A9X0CJP3_9CNID|nr:hypothetical protein OS493_023795 [Desmophyllum pertusum]
MEIPVASRKNDKGGYRCSECKQGGKEPTQLTALEERRLKIRLCIQVLVHATHCRGINCTQCSCAKMKRVVEHTKTCKRKTGGGCRICQELIKLCCYHAKHCLERECFVPFCRHIKLKLRQQQTQQRFTHTPPTPQIPTETLLPNVRQPPTTEMESQEFPHEL